MLEIICFSPDYLLVQTAGGQLWKKSTAPSCSTCTYPLYAVSHVNRYVLVLLPSCCWLTCAAHCHLLFRDVHAGELSLQQRPKMSTPPQPRRQRCVTTAPPSGGEPGCDWASARVGSAGSVTRPRGQLVPLGFSTCTCNFWGCVGALGSEKQWACFCSSPGKDRPEKQVTASFSTSVSVCPNNICLVFFLALPLEMPAFFVKLSWKRCRNSYRLLPWLCADRLLPVPTGSSSKLVLLQSSHQDCPLLCSARF